MGPSESLVDFFLKYDFISTTITLMRHLLLYAGIIVLINLRTLVSALHFIPKTQQDESYKTKQ